MNLRTKITSLFVHKTLHRKHRQAQRPAFHPLPPSSAMLYDFSPHLMSLWSQISRENLCSQHLSLRILVILTKKAGLLFHSMPSPLIERLPTAVNLLKQQEAWLQTLIPNFPPRLSLASTMPSLPPSLCLFINIPKGVRPCSIYVTTLHLSPRTKRHTSTANAPPILSLYSSASVLQKFGEKKPLNKHHLDSECYHSPFLHIPARPAVTWCGQKGLSCCLGLHGSRLSGWVFAESQADSHAERKIARCASSKDVHQFRFLGGYCTREPVPNMAHLPRCSSRLLRLGKTEHLKQASIKMFYAEYRAG